MARLLIDAGAAVNAKAHASVTPLHAAAETGNVELVSLLVQVHPPLPPLGALPTERLACLPLLLCQGQNKAVTSSNYAP